MFVQALFLYIEKRIIRIIGNPVMDDNCKMVAKFRAITLFSAARMSRFLMAGILLVNDDTPIGYALLLPVSAG